MLRVRASVAIPGSFSDPADVFRAADCFFQPSDVGLNYFLPLAISMELPIVSVNSVQIRQSLDAACDAEGRSSEARSIRPGTTERPGPFFSALGKRRGAIRVFGMVRCGFAKIN